MQCDIINPISSKQVVDVNILKPACVNICGNTLNDHLRWIEEKLCSLTTPECTVETIDWNSFDVTCLRTILDESCLCDTTQAVLMDLVIRSICAIKSGNDTSNTEINSLIEEINTQITNIEGDITNLQDQINNLPSATEELFTISPYSPCVNITASPSRGYKKGSQIILRGGFTEVQTSTTLVFQIPLGYRPIQPCKFVVAHTFGGDATCTISISVLGTATMSISGTPVNSAGQFYIDGITYFINT